MVDPRLAAALAPPRPGRLVRWLGPLSAGVRATDEQIRGHAAHWAAAAGGAFASPSLLVAFGDSLSQGVGAQDPADGYVARLAHLIAETTGTAPGVLNLSRSGARIRDVRDQQLPTFASIVDDLTATTTVVVCTVGSNDLMRGALPHRVADELVALVGDLPDGTIVATLPEAGSMSGRIVNRRLRTAAAATSLDLADVGAALQRWRGLAAGDRFHPNAEGYGVWFDAFRGPVLDRLS